MKTSLQKHSFRTVGLALAIGLGLAASSHSAQAAIVQITLGGADWTKTNSSPSTGPLNITGGISSTSGVQWVNNPGDPFDMFSMEEIWYRVTDINGGWGGYGFGLSDGVTNANTYIQDSRINSGANTVAVASFFKDQSSLTLTRVVFDNASTTLPNNFSLSPDTYPDAFPSSTAVPEPGTFIPAAVLVAGALLRRRRSRSHRGGRATA